MVDGDSAKLRLKIGAIEIEYEGKASFLQDDLFSLMGKVVGFYAEHKAVIPAAPSKSEATGANSEAALGNLDHSTNTIAAHLGAKSGADLVIAAAAHLTFVKQQDKFSRGGLDAEIKSATTYYTKYMSSNLSASLNTLVKGKRLNQIAKGQYALSATEKGALEAKFAQPI